MKVRVVAALVVSVLVALVALEATFRGMLVQPVVPATDDAFVERVSRHWPRPIERLPSPGVVRIVSLGDSFGRVGGHENFNYLVERRLQRRGIAAEVVNLSIPALELHDELEMWRAHGPRYQPAVVLHNVFVGNDFLMPDGQLVQYGEIVLRRDSGLASWWPGRWLVREWWRRRQVARRESDRRSRLAAWPSEAPIQRVTQEGDRGTFSESEFLRIERQRLGVTSNEAVWVERRDEAVRVIESTRRAVEESGAQYVVVLHPDQFQVEPGLRARIEDAYAVDIASDFDLELPQGVVLDYCGRQGLDCLDLLPVMREAGSAGGLYLPRDTHYNSEGNRVAAQAIVAFLRRNGAGVGEAE